MNWPSRSAFLTLVLAVQSVATLFFVADVTADLLNEGTSPEFWIEALAALALIAGLVSTLIWLSGTLAELRANAQALAVAGGALGKVIADQFRVWGLTPAESDVAFLALKGLDVAEIAGHRQAATGTVRAQLSAIYAKAGVSGRAQFAAWFVEDLLGEGLSDRPAVRSGDKAHQTVPPVAARSGR